MTQTTLTLRVAKRFTANVDNINLSIDIIAAKIAQAADIIVSALLNENRILVCGNDSTNLLAQYTVSKFINQFETQRPALPALLLNHCLLMNTGSNNDFDEIFSRQIQALGKGKDILLIFMTDELDTNIINAIQMAHEQNMFVILICGDTSEDISPYINKNDRLIQLDIQNNSQVMEVQLLSIHCLCDLIDHLLFGTP